MDSLLPAGGGGPGYPESTSSSSLSGGGYLWDKPFTSSAAAAGGGRMRLMCSFGGLIVPRPTDKSLCYLGGETRIVAVDRNTTLADVHARLSRSLLGGRPFTLKYQHPNEDLDFLITVSTDEDLDNFIDEYDSIAASSSGGGSSRTSRIRLFLFPVKPESSCSLGSSNSKNLFIEALNSAVPGSLDNILRRVSTESPSVNRLLGLEDDYSTHSREGVANSRTEADQRANQQKPPKPEVPPVANPPNSRRGGKNTVLDEARSPCFRVVTLVDVSEAEAAGKMEAPTSASLGAMGSLLRKLDVLLASGCRLPEAVKDGMHLLKDDIEEISGCLQDLSEVEDPPLTANCWMKEVRELSYDIEDYIDKFVRPARANIKTRFVCKISHVKFTRLPKRLKWHQKIANMISEFRIYVQEAIERHERYELHCCTFRRRFVSVGPMLPMPYEETAEMVIDGRMNEFINSLANDEDQQLKVVSIVGPECLGKTTLAKMLYNKFGGQFDCRAFIRVSQKPDMKRLFCDMLWQVQRQPPPDDCKELDLIDNIRKHLQDKRYLIIIDDLWAASVWDIINHAFPEGSQRSRIITTTQIEDVALTCCCYRSEYVFEMKPLDDDHSRKLFFNRLFGSESECPQQFKQISNKAVEICGGLPLATVHIASLFESQPVILLDLWMYVCDSLSSDLRTNSTSERMRQVLNLSFNNLPHHLKTCLLYLNMYPEGHTICKDDLVKQWVAEGFVDRIEGRDMEKVAGSYLDELIDRRFIQPIDINYNDEVLSCTVHDVVHDLIAYKSVEQNFIVVVDYYRKNVEICDKVRRLSVCFGNAKYAKTPANIRTSQVRSLTFFGLFKCMPSITEFKLLRVLNLQLSGHHGDDTLDLTGISELFQLRYLKIACNICIELPNHMRGLQYLETLDIDTKVTAVPWDIIHIPRLLHLRLPVETNLLDWIGSMRSVSDRSLGNLTNLRDLYLTCSTPPSDHLERNMEALGSLLRVLGNLKTLALAPGSSHKNVAVRNASKVIVSWDNLAPPLLQRFDWLPQSCMFSRVPKWIGELGNLCILKIAVRELLRNGVAILKGMPALTALSLHVQTAPVERIVFDKAGFSVLKYFKFKCSVPWLKFEADAMPNLRKLVLGFNALGADQHGTARISIEHLPGLKEISAKIGGAGSDADSALAITVSSDPRNPRINVQGRSMASQEQEHGTLVDQDEIMEDDPDEDSGEDENKQTGIRISTLPESSLHLPVPELKKYESKPAIVEDAMVSVSMGAMNSLLTKLITLMGEGYAELGGMREEVKILKDHLGTVSAFLGQLADMSELSMQMKAWRNQMREMTYDIEDHIDEIMLQFDKDIPQAARYSEKWVGLRNIIHQLRDLEGQVGMFDLRKAEMHTLGPSYVATESQLPTAYCKAVGLVGMDGPRDELVRQMMSGEQQQKVVCILGPGGLGKTTLAKEVRNKIGGRFDCQVFVTVSQKIGITNLLKNILSQLIPEPYYDPDMKSTNLINFIRRRFQDKRYLVVIDGVSSISIWGKIKSAFPENNRGSRIIVTTRVSELAESCGKDSSCFIHHMRPLPAQDSQILFRSIIFGSARSCPVALEKIADKILEACGGVPLAIIIIAVLLANKPAQVAQWEMVEKRMDPAGRGDLTIEGMKKILGICYSDLPRRMKSCFLYLSVFPENHVIRKDRLIWRWIAEGFIPRSGEESLWETGERYFQELISRKLIEPAEDEWDEKPLGCKVHGLILEFITSLSNEEDFVTTDAKATFMQHGVIRRLTVNYGNQEDDDAFRPSTVDLPKVRSLTISGDVGRMGDHLLSRKHFRVGLRFLRVLDLEDADYLGSHHLEGIEGLVLLRYLGLGETGIVWRLTKEIGKLQHLETLYLRRTTTLDTLPASIVGLRKLVRLLLSGRVEAPKEIWKMQELEEVSTISVDRNSSLNPVSELLIKSKRLRMLGVTWEKYPYERTGTYRRSVMSFLNEVGQSSLQSLLLEGYPAGDLLDLLLDSWVPPHHLRRFELTISGTLRGGVPPKMASLVNLTHLRINKIYGIETEGLRVLGDLPNLILLNLHSEYSAIERLIISRDGFLCLVVFSYTCPEMGLQFTPGAMPQLRRLRFEFNARETTRHGDLDFGIQHLSCLTRVHATIRCWEWDARDLKSAEAAIREQVSNNPSTPVLEFSTESLARW